jgi:alpha-galactosidase
LRSLVIDEMVPSPDLSGMPGDPEFPCLVANSWGVLEDTSTERILAMMDATAAVGAEVFVVDKGWERLVGDWHANDRFPSGLRWLSDQARERGMGFGVWCGFGNADPASPVALDHSDWLARWRGEVPKLSFGNYALCLGHDPARDWILEDLRRMVTEFRLTWFLHDFESIARCDRDDHTHDPGAGEHAAEAAWHHILRTLKAEFPQLVLENCWNGVRPLDLAMVRSHHTTITEDHCLSHWNSLAKVGLGRYLPLDWQSAYMGAEDLPPRARIAPYVIGGPWVLMDDPENWSDETRETLVTAAAAFRRWRGLLRTATVCRPVVDRDHTTPSRPRPETGMSCLQSACWPEPIRCGCIPPAPLGISF